MKTIESLERLPSVLKVVEFQQTRSREVFKTKSGGDLTVLFTLPFDLIRDFFKYDEEELREVPKDIRGLRQYQVRHLPTGRIGGTEFHRVRQEIVFGLAGSVKWECEDVFGAKREFLLTLQNGIYMPPYILHTYCVEEEGSGLAVVCNTSFPLPADQKTNDTFSKEEFLLLQRALSPF